MRKPASFLDDFSLDEDDEKKTNYADPLCCPEDPLDEVLMYIPTLDPKILEALGIDCSLPPPRDGLLGYSPSAEENFNVSYLERAGTAGHMVSSYPTASAPSSTSWEPESSDRASSFRHWDVPTKPRRKQVAVRKRAWSHPFLDFPSTPVVVANAADHDTHGVNSANANFDEFSYANANKLRKLSLDDDDGNFSKLGHSYIGKFSSGNCGGGHRRLAGRQRDRRRQKKGTVCSHCHATETPQWRTGPDGPGTLCNACGIRYRMGRDKLVPEYLPSTSPFFRSGEHSNRHSKVEKLREKKVKALEVGFGATNNLTSSRSNGNADSSFS